MDSKRKVNGGGPMAGEELDDRATKRRKVELDEVDLRQGETVETTTHWGLHTVNTLRATQDKSGRKVATNFLTLPDRRELPDYYNVIKMPIALDTVEAKLRRGEFDTLEKVESYIKRMIANAKEYNEKGSEVYGDAERLRKALSNFMVKKNPAYQRPGYSAYPTPLPTSDDMDMDMDEDAEGEPDSEAERDLPKRSRGRPPKNTKSQSQRKSESPTASEARDTEESFAGLTFQRAQEKIIEDLMAAKEQPEDDFSAYEPFVTLPDKSLRKYYREIQKPVSLMSMLRRVKGSLSGTKDGAVISEFKTWRDFEAHISLIWLNAREYNRDGSDLFVLSKELENHFKKIFIEVKKAVPEPTGPKIKLKLGEDKKILLKFGGKASPAESPAPQTNGSSGTPANGNSRRNPFGGSHSSITPVPNLDQLDRARSASGSAASPTPSTTAMVKNEEGARNSPALPAAGQNGYRVTSQSASTPGLLGNGMRPPSTPGFPQSYTAGGYAQSFPHQPPHQSQTVSYDRKFRQPGKDASNAMITNLSIATHTGLNLSRHFRMDIPASPTVAQQSVTITLPHTHYYLQIKPSVAPSMRDLQYNIFCTSGSQRLNALPAAAGRSVDLLHPLYEARLLPGVNEIVVSLIAAVPKKESAKPQFEVELEKITVFATLLKDPNQR